MKRKIGFIVILAGIAVLIIGIVKILGNRNPGQGELRINSDPSANVFLDSSSLGKSPYDEKVNAGEYTIKLVPDAATGTFAGWQGNVTVSPNLLTYVNANLSDSDFTTAVDVLWLEKISGTTSELSVTTNPAGAAVSLDGDTKGVTPLTLPGVAAGDHTLTLSSPGFLSRSFKIKTTPGYKLIGSIKLALFPGGVSNEEASPSPSITASETQGGSSPSGSVRGTGTPETPYIVVSDTPTGFLRVRMGPTTGATEAAQVKPGETFHVFDEQDGWFEISYDGTNKGWVSGQYATETK
ncbi:PEGA domain-containing protein [Patescibacteria group bacterium]|nr:PEGA domain-containing protein [Patescibacteria group bacterium]